MKLTRNNELTELEEFIAKFPTGDKWKFTIDSTPEGKIKEVKTKDKEIIAWLKKKGFSD